MNDLALPESDAPVLERPADVHALVADLVADLVAGMKQGRVLPYLGPGVLSLSSDVLVPATPEALVAQLTAIEGEIYQYRNRSSQDPLNYPIRLNNKLAALQGVVEAGDGAPTAQSVAVFEELSGRLDEQLRRVEAAVAGEVAAFNRALTRRKLVPVATAVPTVEEVAALGTSVKDLEAEAADEVTSAKRW